MLSWKLSGVIVKRGNLDNGLSVLIKAVRKKIKQELSKAFSLLPSWKKVIKGGISSYFRRQEQVNNNTVDDDILFIDSASSDVGGNILAIDSKYVVCPRCWKSYREGSNSK